MKTGNASPPPGRKGCRVWYNPSAMANTDILSFGAAGDGATLCTKPIQAAVAAASTVCPSTAQAAVIRLRIPFAFNSVYSSSKLLIMSFVYFPAAKLPRTAYVRKRV